MTSNTLTAHFLSMVQVLSGERKIKQGIKIELWIVFQ